MKKILLLSLLFSLLFLGLSTQVANAKPFLLNGRIDYNAGLEGGCWFLTADNGDKYQLLGTETQLEQVQIIGRMIKVRVEEVNNMASICMVGQMVRIIDVIDVIGMPVDPAYVTLTLTGRVYKTRAGCWYIKTSKGQKYELASDSMPRSKKKSGARVNQKFRVFLGKQASNCGLDGYAVFQTPAPANKAAEKRPADPR